jgi:hypothetical protein
MELWRQNGYNTDSGTSDFSYWFVDITCHTLHRRTKERLMNLLIFLIGFVVGFTVCGVIWFVRSPLESGHDSGISIDEHWDG